MHLKRTIWAVGLAACLMVAAPGAADEGSEAEIGPAVGSQALDFTLRSVTDDLEYSLSESRGERPVALVFFRGSW